MKDVLVTGFAPILSPEITVVILGSVPGQASLRLNQYYAAPRNLFWPIMDRLFGISRKLPYEERLDLLIRAGVGLWDVLKHCERDGSLDASIVSSTEVPNDFSSLFERCPAVKAICFNGRKAETAFRRHVIRLLPPETRKRIDFVTLPSTSPANTAANLATKLDEWKAVLRYAKR